MPAELVWQKGDQIKGCQLKFLDPKTSILTILALWPKFWFKVMEKKYLQKSTNLHSATSR